MNTTNVLPRIDKRVSTTGCCTLIHPDAWDNKEFVFEDALFAKARVNSFLHVPLNMGSVMRKSMAMIKEAEAETQNQLVLSYESSPWHSTQYFAVDREVPGMESEKISGTFLTKVFDGPFKDAPIWHTQLIDLAQSKGYTPLKTFFYYTLCPKCSKVYGRNYVVGFEQIA